MSAFHDVILAGASGSQGYQISRSVRLRSSASAYFNRTLTTPTSGTTWTWSGWVKRGALGTENQIFSAGAAVSDQLFFQNSTDVLIVYLGANTLVTSQVFRDPSSWYHIVLQVDTTQATASNRVRLYINGTQVTAFSSTSYPTQNATTKFNSASAHNIGRYQAGASGYFDGYLTEVNFIDGQALTPSSFGETDAVTGVWKPKKYAGTYGTNGFYLNFSDNSNNTAATIGKDSSGNGNNWTPNNISVNTGVTYDSVLDTPTPYADGGNGRGNYAVWNPLDKRVSGSSTFANGNLSATVGASGSTEEAFSTFAFPSSGKWYCEVTVSNIASGNARIGIANLAFSVDTRNANGYLYQQDGQKYVLGTASAYGSSWTTNDVIGVAFDADAGSITFYKNNTSQGAITGISTSAQWVFGSTGRASVLAANFGQQPFAYTPPTGFKALNTQNLPAGSITTSGSFTGNASSDGPFVYLNGVPTAMTINGNAVTFATHVDKTANGFKVRSSSSSYNASGSNTYSITTTGAKFKYANAQVNP